MSRIIGMGTPISQSSNPLPKPISMSSARSASALLQHKRPWDRRVPSGACERAIASAEVTHDSRLEQNRQRDVRALREGGHDGF
jgi:hypothetical protein